MDFSKGDAVMDEMQINLNVFGPLVLNGIGGQVNSTDIIAVHNSGPLKRAMELV